MRENSSHLLVFLDVTALKGRLAERDVGNQRASDAIRAAIRTVFRIMRIPGTCYVASLVYSTFVLTPSLFLVLGVESVPPFVNFYRAVLKTASISAIVKEVQATMPAK